MLATRILQCAMVGALVLIVVACVRAEIAERNRPPLPEFDDLAPRALRRVSRSRNQ